MKTSASRLVVPLAGMCLVALASLAATSKSNQRAPHEEAKQGSPHAPREEAAVFHSAWPVKTTRTWVGPDYWANRLQDWRIAEGRLECLEASRPKPMRVVHLLTAALGPQRGTLAMSVRTGAIEPAVGKPGGSQLDNTWTGFLIGAGGEHVDYRLTALAHHKPAEDGGLIAALDGTGKIVFRDFSRGGSGTGGWAIGGAVNLNEMPELPAAESTADETRERKIQDVDLKLAAQPSENGDTYEVTLAAHDHASGKLIAQSTLKKVDPKFLDGGIALVSHLGPAGSEKGYWFRDWQASGSKLVVHPDRHYGPVLCTQHTLSHGTLKMTAQMPPLGADDTQTAELQIRDGQSNEWRTVAQAKLVEHSYTFPFRVENWDADADVPYRVRYELRTGPDSTKAYTWEGTIRREPHDKKELVVAAFTGHKIFTGGLKWNHNGVWFPHNELVAAVTYHKPDFLFFSGDQVYEGDLTGAQFQPLDKAILDYLDKWYRWCWAFRDLTRYIPAVTIPDDHDVYHGNIWGAGGKQTSAGFGQPAQDSGGYKMGPVFVNMVERTQTSHLPDPFDPTPVEQGIGVYYTDVNYGGVSFAVIEDRKWKSSPTVMVPEGQVVNGWFQNRNFDPAKQADAPGAKLLDERQLKFLNHWSQDYSGGVWMKVALSQTIFANVATLPADATSDSVVPRLEYYPPGEYPKTDKPVADADSNGWPQTGRNKALRELRRGFAFHIAGDQHLGSFIRYGVDEWDDAGFALCVPSVANTFPRRWFPPEPGRNHKPGDPPYTGQYLDGFGNHMTVHAVSNPVIAGKEPAGLYNRAPGYGIVRLRRASREIVAECWPRWVDPSEENAEQYLGWPITVRQMDNYGRPAAAFLPEVVVTGMTDPVVQVIDETNGEVVYTIRIQGSRLRPKVFAAGKYTIKVGEPGTAKMREFKQVASEDADRKSELRVEF